MEGLDWNNIITLMIAVFTFFTAIMAYFTRKDMAAVHAATNSMKDALIKETATSAYAEGETKAREAAEQKAEVIAAKVEGQLKGQPLEVEVVKAVPVDVVPTEPVPVVVVEKGPAEPDLEPKEVSK